MIDGFLPIVDQRTTIMILGTMPSVESLLQAEYYGNPRNHFWKIIFSLFESGRSPVDYNDKLSVLKRHGIGLWDVLSNCDRQGSLDSKIKNESYTDIPLLLTKYPAIEMLVFNGQKSYHYFKKAHGEISTITCIVMPSTSPANATKSFEQKLQEWEKGLCYRYKK